MIKLPSALHIGTNPSKIMPMKDRPELYKDSYWKEHVLNTYSGNYSLEEVCAAPYNLGMLQLVGYEKQKQELSREIGLTVTQYILEKGKNPMVATMDMTSLPDKLKETGGKALTIAFDRPIKLFAGAIESKFGVPDIGVKVSALPEVPSLGEFLKDTLKDTLTIKKKEVRLTEIEKERVFSGVGAGDGDIESQSRNKKDDKDGDNGKEEVRDSGKTTFTPWTKEEIELWEKEDILPQKFQQELQQQWQEQVIWPTKSLEDVGNNLKSDFLAAEKFANSGLNVPLVTLAITGEVSEYLGQRVVCGVSMLSGGEYVLDALSLVGTGVAKVKDAGKKLGSWVLSEHGEKKIEKSYNNLPNGVKLLGDDLATGGILYGTGKLFQFTKAKITLPKEHYEYLTKMQAHGWHQVGDYIKQVPQEYVFKGYADGAKTTGLVFKNGSHNEIVIKKAKPDADYPSQHVDYVSYKVDGKYVARNGDYLYVDQNDKTIILRQKAGSKEFSPIPKEELQRLGVNKPERHPDVHIPVNEFFKKFGGDN